ncbi:LacI family DNA-binding transcriptional regulator [Agrococcus sp. HG114]|uniref:LacI family DNA-binding transcriptional regulator n=1 Tax=Agrococcus sp. HG114 TaxID=2969757 RepID=UPI00215A1475|nr:LacI family DNA-binding transcriptional regulator [Agrococcus sp. HG114]MCR8669777.1 LacI family transcriptional regulator [Agrococcus sp. HG114]
MAERAGVSVPTVSRVLNGKPSVSAELTAQVRKAMHELDFHPSQVARNLRAARTNTIGVVLPGLQNPFFPRLIEQVVEVAAEHGLTVSISLSPDPLPTAETLARTRAVDGLVLVGRGRDDDDAALSGSIAVPVVAFDRAPASATIPLFQIANADGARTVTAHLLERAAARPLRLLHIAGPEGLDVTEDRLAGMVEAIDAARAAGRAVDVTIVHGDFTEASGHELAAEWLADASVGVIFAANDMMAIGAIVAAKQRGAAIGGDLLIAGFDGVEVGEYVSPSLTTYRQPISEIAREAVTHLVRLMQGEAQPAESRPVHRFAGELVVRESTGGDA